MKCQVIIRNENIKRWIRNCLVLIGSALILIGLKYDTYWVALVGSVVGAVGLYASQAAAVGVTSFGRQPSRKMKGEGAVK